MGKKVEFEQFDPQKGIFEGYIGWGLLQQQPLGTNRVKGRKGGGGIDELSWVWLILIQ